MMGVGLTRQVVDQAKERRYYPGEMNHNLEYLIIVAHPDDETIFFGDFLRLNPDDTKVVCVTSGTAGDSGVRREKFEKAMQFYGCRHYEIWRYPDRGIRYEIQDHCTSEGGRKFSLEDDLKRVLNEHDYKKVITHNASGEYGHPHHKQIHWLVKNIYSKPFFVFKRGEIISDEGWRFKNQAIRIYCTDARWLFYFISCFGNYESLEKIGE